MVFKELEIQGFKSFPDKVKIRFDEGVTGVVGPNGSGKSNLSDAVRWVLGETSTRQLRAAGKMEDVIFGGTRRRGAMGFAQVRLTLDNSAHTLDIDADEAVIAALYLDGGMEVARNFILPFITEGKHAEADYKTRLQEIVQQNPEERLSYVVEQESGPDHDKHFVVAVRFNSDKVARGEGRSKKMAEQHAAREALKLLGVLKEK